MEPELHSRQLFRFGLFEADPSGKTLTRNGVRVRIQDQPFQVLLTLLERPGEIITREELRQNLWPEGTYVDFDGSLNVILKRLRLAIDDSSDNPRFIETIPRSGYRFIAPVSVGGVPAAKADVNALPSTAPPQADANSTISARRLKKPRRVVLAYAASILLVIALIAAAEVSWYRRPANANRLTLSAHASPPVLMRTSAAVLGFHNLSGNASDAWLATAFSEMLSTELAAGEKLRLISGQDVANLRASFSWPQSGTLDQKTATSIGAALNTDLLVLGSYAVLGESKAGQLRLDVRLQDAKTGEILTEIAQAGERNNAFQLVSVVGSKLRTRLGVPPVDEPQHASVVGSLPSDPDAARFYALGVARLREFDLQSAKDLLQQACNAAPKFCPAHFMLARAWSGLGYEQKRKEEAKKALDLSIDLPRAEQLLVQGNYYESLSDHQKAASTYRVLFNLFPDSVEYGVLLATAQHAAGHDSEASETLAQLRRLPAPASDDPRIDLVDVRAGPKSVPVSLALIRSAERKASAQGKKLIYAQARKEECMNLNYSEHPDQAFPACEEAYNIYLAAGNRLMAADSLRLIGDFEGSLGQNDKAIATYQRALKMLEELGEHYKTGAVLNNMAVKYANLGKLDRAEQLYRRAKFHFEQVGDKGNTSIALVNIGDILFLRGDLPRASKQYEQSLEIQNSLDHGTPTYLLSRLSDLALTQGRVQDAHHLAQQAIDIGRPKQGDYGNLTAAMISLGEALKAEGDLQGARRQFQEALEIRQKVGQPDLVQENQTALAELDLEEAHADQAESRIRPAIAEFEREKTEPDATSAYTGLSRALLMQGKVNEARNAIQHASELGRNSPDPALNLPIAVQNSRIEMAGAAQLTGAHLAAVRAQLRNAIGTARKLGYYGLECEARLALGEVELKTNPSAGRSLLMALREESHQLGMELASRKAQGLLTGAAPLSSPSH